jgi:steroid 5-alpha reductase family enzyme
MDLLAHVRGVDLFAHLHPQLKVTQMTEARMLANAARAPLYREYQRTTSMLVPWPKHKPTVAPENATASVGKGSKVLKSKGH